jgi:hypothetical protein
MNILKIKAVREEADAPHLDCYSQDLETLTALEVAKVIAKRTKTQLNNESAES